MHDRIVCNDARHEGVDGRVLPEDACARVRLDDERECLVVPPVVSRTVAVAGADVVQVRGKVWVGRALGVGEVVGVVV